MIHGSDQRYFTLNSYTQYVENLLTACIYYGTWKWGQCRAYTMEDVRIGLRSNMEISGLKFLSGGFYANKWNLHVREWKSYERKISPRGCTHSFIIQREDTPTSAQIILGIQAICDAEPRCT